MAARKRFPRPSCVFVDGDQDARVGCLTLPGGDAPERVVFDRLAAENWSDLHERISRGYGSTADACTQTMTDEHHHIWVQTAADQLLVAGDVLWQAMCACWVQAIVEDEQVRLITETVTAALDKKTLKRRTYITRTPKRVAIFG